MGATADEIRDQGAFDYSVNSLKKRYDGPIPHIVLGAFAYAAGAHDGQVRRSSGLPYVIHPTHVACILKKYVPDASDDLIAACLLHDTVEDTGVTVEDIAFMFNDEIAEIVWDVTKRDYGDIPKLEFKRLEGERIGLCRPESQTLKCADAFSNVRDMKETDPARYVTYVKESEAVVSQLQDADPRMLRKALEMFSEPVIQGQGLIVPAFPQNGLCGSLRTVTGSPCMNPHGCHLHRK